MRARTLCGAIAAVALAAGVADGTSSAMRPRTPRGAGIVGDDTPLIRQRLLDLLCYPPASSTNVSSFMSTAHWYADSLLPNGTWADIDYDDPTDRALWKTATHLSRTVFLATASAWPYGNLTHDGFMINRTRLALNAWLTNDWQNNNWWWDIISTPQQMSCIYLMLGVAPDQGSFPDAFELSKGLEIMFRAAWWNASLGYETTGANLAWMIQAQVARGALAFAENITALEQGFTRLWQEAKVVNRSLDFNLAQGIQQDWSYSFHGPQLQPGSYGQDYTGEMLLMIDVTAGTQYVPPPAAVDLLCEFWATGQSFFTVGNAFDWTSVGRQVSRPGENAEYAVSLNTTRIRIAAGECPNAATGAGVASWADRIERLPDAAPQVGTQHFWCNDATVHRKANFVAVLHMHSLRTDTPECGNGENLLGRYMGEGALSFYGTACGNGSDGQPLGCGQEYAAIFPLFDWTLIPGTLAPADIPIPCNCTVACCWTSQVEKTSFVGAATDGSIAASGMDTHIYTLSARRAWFFFDAAVAALTADATDTSGIHHWRTSLAQQWYVDPYVSAGFANGTVSQLPDGNFTLPTAQWLHADGTGWIPLPAATGGHAAVVPTVDAGERTGNWVNIGPSNFSVSGRTVRLALDHGIGLQGASWGYAVVPNVTAADMPGLAGATAGLDVVVNTPFVQAVAKPADRAVGAAFWPPPGCPSNASAPSGPCPGGALAYTAANGFALSVNASAPCFATFIEDVQAGTGTLAVANPDTPGGLVIKVAVNRLLKAGAACAAAASAVPGWSVVSFVLPADSNTNMGQSVVQTCALAS